MMQYSVMMTRFNTVGIYSVAEQLEAFLKSELLNYILRKSSQCQLILASVITH